MPDPLEIGETTGGFVAPARTGPNPFLVVDPAIVECLPPNSTILSITPHANSFWTQTARLDVLLAPNDTPASFFVKVTAGEKGKGMALGELASITALYEALPADKKGFVPKAYGAGEFRDIKGLWFYVCEFRDIVETLPPVGEFVATLALVHGTPSPTGRYGFHETTYMGPEAQVTGWTDSWEELFVRNMRHMLAIERGVHGASEELDELCEKVYGKVIPRLLRPMETLGSVRPVLVHGDLWYGNVCVDRDGGGVVVFDAGAMYGHNEYEIGTWRAKRYRFGQEYIQAYWDVVPPTAPEEDADDRNALYSIKYDTHSSWAYYTSTQFRSDFMATMRMLVDKYPEGYEGWERANRERIAAVEAAAITDVDDDIV